MLPTMTDLTAIGLQIGEFLLEIGPFIVFGAVAAAAQVTLMGRKPGPWTGERLIAPIAAIPLGLTYMLVAALRSALLFQTSPAASGQKATAGSGILQRAMGYLDDLILPLIVSTGVGALLVVLTPTEPLWSLLGPDQPWRLLIAPLIAGIVRPRGGAELPLVMAMVIKGLDPAGAIAAIAGAGYLHARTIPLGILHAGFGAGLGLLYAAADLSPTFSLLSVLSGW